MRQVVLEFREVSKHFGSVCAVNQVSFSIYPGEIFTLLGPSGCGKTTTLRLIAGLEEPDEGEILLNEELVAAPKKGVFVVPDKRRMGMVFQSYAIWPHLTVFENVAFPLRVRREKGGAIKNSVLKVLETVGLAGFEERGATELSGGQQQRVALARALVYAPALLLLDEPLSNLDAKLREEMRFELRALQRKLKLTILYVTHDQTEAMTLSDRIAIVHRGRFEQVGTPAEVYEKPVNSFVGEFLGRTVIFEGTVIKNHSGHWIELVHGSGRLFLNTDAGSRFAGAEPVCILTRPEDIQIFPQGELSPNQIAGKIEEVAYLGDHFEYQVSAGGSSFMLSAPKRERHYVGSQIRLSFDLERLNIHPR
ncbi:MAG TPA: ABC transporter ATP-binding protein [Candidatus Binatia bacterium]|jgi:ABC-type Fe3+/spermidine/putrescine transport system ATPase subunit|nr:ABC transporter ATP-binding protein [Candidatus Binatia bacterium]